MTNDIANRSRRIVEAADILADYIVAGGPPDEALDRCDEVLDIIKRLLATHAQARFSKALTPPPVTN